MSPVNRQIAARSASSEASSRTDTATTSRLRERGAEPGDHVRRRLVGSGDREDRRPVDARLGDFAEDGTDLGRIGAGPGAVDDGVRGTEDAEERAATAAVVGRPADEPGDLDELDEDATDARQGGHGTERREGVVAGLDLDVGQACRTEDLPTFGGPTRAICAAPSRRTAIESQWTAFERTRVSSISASRAFRRSAYGPFL